MSNLLKTLALVVVFSSFMSLFVFHQASAVNLFPSSVCGGSAGSGAVCTDVNNQQTSGTNPIIHTLKIVIQVISAIIGIIAVIMIIVGGLRLILSNGDPQTINSARTSIIYAMVGILVAVIAQTIVVFVLDNIK